MKSVSAGLFLLSVRGSATVPVGRRRDATSYRNLRRVRGQLIRRAEVSGFTTHTIGSRNLDLGLVADADGDDRLEVLVPNQSRTELGVLRRTDGGVEVVAEVDIPGRLASNLAAVADQAGRIWFAAGTDQGMLRVWPGTTG